MQIQSARPFRRWATGLVRTLIVASATLAILLVCFSIYQYSQLDPDEAARLRNQRLPSTPIEPAEYHDGNLAGDASGVDIGRGRIGPGQKIQITLYPREGRRARLEIAVDDWTPIEGSSNEFLLTGPDVRMRTKDGHAVRVTAGKGIMEARRASGGGLDPQRGKLTGDVVILYDRLSERDRAKLPPELHDRIDPADLVRIDLDEIEFDLEYSKVTVPGRLHLSARDADLRTADLEIRFNDAQNRIEHMRISQSGRIELRGRGEQLGLSIPKLEEMGEQQVTLVEWIRASVQAKLETRTGHEPGEPSPPATPDVSLTDKGVPVFRPDVVEQQTPRPAIRYYARFEGDIDARQLAGDVASARLEADVLELVRNLSAEDQARVRAAGEKPTTESDEAATPSNERIVLEWTKRLIVDICSPGDDRCAGEMRSKLTATGSPARLSHPDGYVTCTKLAFVPDGSKVWLYGMATDPATVRYTDQGTLSGLMVYSERQGDDMYVHVTGPGKLVRNPVEAATPSVVSDTESLDRSTIEFADRLDAHGRFVTRTSIDFTGRVSSRRLRVLDRATFVGRVKMHQDDTGLSADTVTLTFGEKRGVAGNGQTVQRVAGEGHVVMTQGADRVTCREIAIALTIDRDGGTVPQTATALGDIVVEQNERTVQARDKLIVDFEMVNRPAGPFDADKAHAAAIKAGLDVAEVDWDARRREHEAKLRREVGVRRFQASGEVTVVDSVQLLDVTAEMLDCTVKDGREIETAFVDGLEGSPASVRLNTFTVSGQTIKLNVPDQWAEIPGAGRMTFRSYKDLDGRRLSRPIPIAVTWNDWMKYQGRENRSVFSGQVHATSQNTTTFDCDRLEVHFDDVAPPEVSAEAAYDWWIFQDVIDRLGGEVDRPGPRLGDGAISKEPAYILATGNAVALTSEIDPATDRLKGRARIAGPKLSVNLRPDVSKMLIEGPGNLLLEDYRPASSTAGTSKHVSRGLFAVDEDADPSNTLIEWGELMWYDFSIDQTRFEGNVSLKHFSGAELDRIRGRSVGGSADASPGRSTFLTCNVLTVDFLGRQERSHQPEKRRMGRLSSDRLRQFQASGSVTLQDFTEGLSLTADRVIYEKQRKILAIYGTLQRKAHIVTQKPGRLPNQISAERLFFNLSTGRVEVSKPAVKAQ